MAEAEDRIAICERHGISPRFAPELYGETPAQWESDAAARAAVAQMFGAQTRQQPEPEPEPSEPEPPATEEPRPAIPDAAQLAAESREQSDRQFIEQLFAPKRGAVEAIRDFHSVPGEEQR